MNWKALKTCECPIDGAKLRIESLLSDKLYCPTIGCDFKVGEERLVEIATDASRKRPRLELNGLPRL